MSGLGYDLCFFVAEDNSLAGALIEVFLSSLIQIISVRLSLYDFEQQQQPKQQ